MFILSNFIRWGLTTVVQEKATFNDKSLYVYDANKPITNGMFGDINSVYSIVVAALLPIGEFYELKPEEIENFIPFIQQKSFLKFHTPTDGKYFDMHCIDYYIPDDVKRATDDLPMRVKQEINTAEKNYLLFKIN